jgi:hypothetical protein
LVPPKVEKLAQAGDCRESAHHGANPLIS